MTKIVTFTASWCQPCTNVKSILQEISDKNLIVWENHDIDKEKNLAIQMGIKGVPTLFFYDGDEIKLIENGYKSRSEILELYGVEETLHPGDVVEVTFEEVTPLVTTEPAPTDSEE